MATKRISSFLVLCFSLALSLALTAPRVHAQKPPAPVFTTIDVPGAGETDANDINTNGVIVGYDCVGSVCSNPPVAQAWVQINGAFKFLKPPGSTSALAYGINDSNTVVGWYFDSAGVPHGFSFSKGKYTKIDPPGSTYTNAWSINSAGTIVGTYIGSDGIFHGFTLSGTTYTTYNAPNAGLTEITGIDNTGANMVGIYDDSNSVQHGFQLTNGTTFTTIDPPGSNTTAADRINDSGTIVGLFCPNSTCTANTGPFVGYQKKGTTFSKINFPSSTETRCRGINNAGVIVGRYMDSTGAIHGMMVTP